MRRVRPFASILLLSLLAGSAFGQTGLGIEAGVLLPTGDLGNSSDPSPYFGVRWEIQDVNPLGQVAALSVLFRAGYAPLSLDGDLEQALVDLGENDPGGGSIFDIGGGVRAYSTASPLFVSAGASYVSFDPAGDELSSLNGFGAHAGLGVVLGVQTVKIDLEARGNLVAPEEIDSFHFFQILASLGFPF